MTTLLINWYKPSGKWYASCRLEVPADFKDSFTSDPLRDFIELHQDQLAPSWVKGDWYVSVACIEQADEDPRFFERLMKYGNV